MVVFVVVRWVGGSCHVAKLLVKICGPLLKLLITQYNSLFTVTTPLRMVFR